VRIGKPRIERWRMFATVLVIASLSIASGEVVAQRVSTPVIEASVLSRIDPDPVSVQPASDERSVPSNAAPDRLQVVLALMAVGIVAAVIVPTWLVFRAIGQARAKRARTISVVQVDPPSVQFGIVRVGQTAVRQLAVMDHGTAAMQFSAVSVSGTGFSLEGIPATPLALALGGRVDFQLKFEPARTCRCSGTLRLRSNGPLEWSVDVQGRAVN
jgi:hypothetical protein